jgi:hypothetical protein
MVNVTVATKNWPNAVVPWCKRKREWPWLTLQLRQRTDLTTSYLHSCDKKETTPSDAREKNSAANRTLMQIHCGLIIDSPSCNKRIKKYPTDITKLGEVKIRAPSLHLFNPLTPELNPSARSCLPRIFTGDLIFRGLNARWLYKSFGVKGLKHP